jgi:dipeptide transport system substrate-binding protein
MMWKTFQSSTGPQKAMWETLIGMDRYTGEDVKTNLATDWSMAPDGKQWTFNLREDVKFHSTDSYTGTEFTAKDVVSTIQTLGREDSLASAAIWQNMGIANDNFNVVNDHEIVWSMDKAEPLANFWLGDEWVAGMISKDYLDAVGMDAYLEHPVGTGPFQFIELEIGSHILYERVENHWRKTPEFWELQFFYIPEEATRLAMLLAEEVHIADIPRTLLTEATTRGFKIANSTLPGFYFYAFIGGQYYDEPTEVLAGARKGEIEPLAPGYSPLDPLRDVRVRKALNLAIDRELIKETFWGDAAIPQSIHNVPPYRFDFKEEWVPYPYDPEQAKKLLADAGYPNGFTFEFLTAKMAGVPEAPDVAEAMAAFWVEVGLDPQLAEIEFGNMLGRQRERDMGQTVFTMRFATGPAPLGWSFPMSNVSGGSGSAIWEYPELDKLYVELKEAVLPEDVLRLTHEIGDWMYANYLIVPMYFLAPQVAYNPGVLVKYEANHLHMGPVRFHEYTEPMFK